MNICCFVVFKPEVPVFLLVFFSFFFFPSPEHPLMRARARSILGGEKQPFQEYTESGSASRFATCCYFGNLKFYIVDLVVCCESFFRLCFIP